MDYSQGYLNNMEYQDPRYQSGWGLQHAGQMHSLSFDPSLPAFHPNGSNVQRLQEPRSLQLPGLSEMKKYIVDMNVAHINDQVRIEHQTYENMQSIRRLEARCMNTYQALEKKLNALQDEQSDEEELPARPACRQLIPFPNYDTDLDISPPEWWKESFGKEELARAYHQEAERAEQCALRLRAQAESLLGRTLEQMAIETSAPPNPGGKVVGYACCETAFESVKELLEHVEKTHTTTTQSKPRSYAVEIKSPAENDTNNDTANEATAQAHVPNKATWIPFAVRQMAPFVGPIPVSHIETFTWEFLHLTFGGAQWSSGFYFIGKKSMLPSSSYWLLDAENEPYLPVTPGQHGAKLTPFFRDDIAGPDLEENYKNVPVFICAKGTNSYRYFGNYSQIRFSDKVDYDHLMAYIPDHVRRYWAVQLAANGRPEWVTQALMEHFWPKPAYDGRFPTDSAINTPLSAATDSDGALERKVQGDLKRYAEELKAWEKEARLKVHLLSSDNLYNSFKDPDLDVEPGLRLFWEYFECVGYDAQFYDMLVQMKNNPRLNTSKTGKPGAQRPPTPVLDNDSTAIKKGEIDAKGRSVITISAQDVSSLKVEARKLDKEARAMQKKAEQELSAEQAKKHTVFTKPTFDEPVAEQATGRKQSKAPAKPNTKPPKNHVGMVKPWETVDATTTTTASPQAVNSSEGYGDMQAAKDFSDEVVHRNEKNGGGAKGGRGVPPHMRGK